MTLTTQGVDVADLVPSLGAQHTVTVTNNSTVDGHNAVLYQDSPSLPDSAVRLAWLARLSRPGTTVALEWTLRYSFVWGRQGNLHAGVDYGAGTVLDARLDRYNVARLVYEGGFGFRREPGAHPPGVLAVLQDETLPGAGAYRRGCVGIGMDGAATFVAPTEPGVDLVFDPHPSYWLGMARYAAGAVVDDNDVTAPVRLTFPNGKTNAHATFNGTDWTLTYA
ncbi:hypothetical protein V5P93_006668 [Actinokineospora auranticolor]|uniref:Uncharacterized protein n=1 Tax=Actinokineospora auranticolor TaxID=155976 RepID=A0A2S6GWU9_9PSEU|nr:hypothetical protein [Actinokineospora auranticolor]PPK69689.1 hypothetical protein CLV40_103299 [Actinokineospora auranticolor]